MIALSSCRIDPDSPVRRVPPRPPELRNAAYAEHYDWDTLFYDVYRVRRHIVFQGPPLLNLRGLLDRSGYLAPRLRGLFPRARLIQRDRSSEYWVRDDADHLVLDGPLGRHAITVQPNLSATFAGRRVLHTLSRNNDPAWICDWVRFYVAVHGADAVLLYDNASTAYSTEHLRAVLRETFPDLVTEVVEWPFPYGPQGGMAGAVDGREAPWDSDYCQTGSLQHARFRFLGVARSVLNVDIDELVLSPRGTSIFTATEQSRSGFTKFEGRWVSATTPHAVPRGEGRHGDFWLRDLAETDECPPKWCVVPRKTHRVKHDWSVHNLFGARANRRVSGDFMFAHLRGISQGWKENRWDAVAHDPTRFVPDETLRAAFAKAGLLRG